MRERHRQWNVALAKAFVQRGKHKRILLSKFDVLGLRSFERSIWFAVLWL